MLEPNGLRNSTGPFVSTHGGTWKRLYYGRCSVRRSVSQPASELISLFYRQRRPSLVCCSFASYLLWSRPIRRWWVWVRYVCKSVNVVCTAYRGMMTRPTARRNTKNLAERLNGVVICIIWFVTNRGKLISFVILSKWYLIFIYT